MSSYIALDWGKARIGVAICDAKLRVPLMRDAFLCEEGVYEKIAELCERERAEKVIVGLPRELSGEEGGSTAGAKEFALRLQGFVDAEVMLFDERFTTTIAQRKMQGSKNKKGNVDSLAAVGILEGWLQRV